MKKVSKKFLDVVKNIAIPILEETKSAEGSVTDRREMLTKIPLESPFNRFDTFIRNNFILFKAMRQVIKYRKLN